MDILLIRHGERDRSYPDDKEQHAPLTASGKEKVECLANQLMQLDLTPAVILTSRFEHARQTADILSAGRADVVWMIDAITPFSRTKSGQNINTANIFETIVEEASEAGLRLGERAVTAIVAHKPRLDYILERLTSSSQFRTLDYAEAVRVRGVAFSEFLIGKGKVTDSDWISCR